MGTVPEKKTFKNQTEEYNYYIENLKGNLTSSEEKEQFDVIIADYAKYRNHKKYGKFPISKLRTINKKLEAGKYCDIIIEMKQYYLQLFKYFFREQIIKQSKPIKELYRGVNSYDELIKKQKINDKYLEVRKTCMEKNYGRKLSLEFRQELLKLILLEDSSSEESVEYLKNRFKEKFDQDYSIYSFNYNEYYIKYIDLWIEKEIETYNSQQNYNKNDSDEEENGNYNDNNSGDEEYTYKSYNSSSSSSSNSRKYYNTDSNDNRNNNTSKKASNIKKKVKVTICYSCKSKNLCPLCGNKITSRVSLGNLYAHAECYNEGTCCVCNQRKAGNQVQSICSDCQKNGNAKGLTGSAKCFECRKLIN